MRWVSEENAKSSPEVTPLYYPTLSYSLYVSYVDAGMLELVRRVTGAEIVSSADLVQLTQAVLDDAQVASHRRAAAHCLAAKDAAFAYVAERLRGGAPVNEYLSLIHISEPTRPY